MSADSKLKQAQEDLRRAEKAVQEARDELAREEKAKPRITEADIVPGARFTSNSRGTFLVIVELGYQGISPQHSYGITGNLDMPFCWYSNGPFTKQELVRYLNSGDTDTDTGYTKTPGKWVFEPEQAGLKDGDIIWTALGDARKVLICMGFVILHDMDGNYKGKFDSIEELEDYITHPEKYSGITRYTREKPGA